ncbi:MAG: hypothetical protein M1823_002265 [Watsoniomyces obsoletus]|nr:MAG: hypothetical protein M1823_002265 [Watsoniomyces obsoletus]
MAELLYDTKIQTLSGKSSKMKRTVHQTSTALVALRKADFKAKAKATQILREYGSQARPIWPEKERTRQSQDPTG